LILAAAARAVRRVPRLHVPRILEALQVVVPDDRRAVPALRPVAAGGVAARRGEHAGRVGPGEDVVLVRGIAAAFDHLALLGERGLLADLVLARMQLRDVVRHHYSFRVAPGTLADAVARVDTRVATGRGRAQVRLPVRVLRAGRLGERIAVRIRAL